jgi:FkbM family methyltransferase
MSIRTVGHTLLPYLVSRSLYSKIHGFVATRRIISGKRYEAGIGLLNQIVRPGDTVIDIGANQGLYSYYLSELVGPNGKVYAFEPIPYNLRILRRIADCRNNIVVRPVGCGEKSETTEFFVPISHRVPIGGWAHRKAPGDNGAGEIVRANIIRVDDEIIEPVSFIKCDIEGAELFALKGAAKILERSRPAVLCEICEPWCLRFGVTKEQVLKFLVAFNYRVQQISEDNFLMTTEKHFTSANSTGYRSHLNRGGRSDTQPYQDLQ